MHEHLIWTPPPVTQLNYRIGQDEPWLIGPCIRPADFVYFVGADGEGKSTLIADVLVGMYGWTRGVLDDATCLAGAWPINTEHLVPNSTCLIINAETSGPDEWTRRLMKVIHTRGYAPNSVEDVSIRDNFYFADSEALILRPKNLTDDAIELAHWIIEQGHTTVCLDPIYGVFRPPDGPGDDVWVNHGLRPLVNTLKAAGVLTIGIAHNNLAAQKAKRTAAQGRYRPVGSGQQNGLADARFGVFRPEDEPRSTRLVKLKDRRAGWLPVGKTQLHLVYAKTAGFSSWKAMNDIDWEIHNPEPFVLKEEVEDLIFQLPARPEFTRKEVDALGLADRLDRCRDTYLLPQQILTMHRAEDQRGTPVYFRWTETGLRFRLSKRRPKPKD